MKVAIRRGPAVDQRADFTECLGDGFRRRAGPGFHVGVGNQVAGHLAGELADGVGSHPVGDHEDVAPLPPGRRVRRAHRRMAVLIVRATHARIRRGRVDDDVVPVHSLTLLESSRACDGATSHAIARLAARSHDLENRPVGHRVSRHIRPAPALDAWIPAPSGMTLNLGGRLWDCIVRKS